LPPDPSAAFLAADAAVVSAQRQLAAALGGIAQQSEYQRLLGARRRRAELISEWLAKALEPVTAYAPRSLLVLGEGILFDESDEYGTPSVVGAIAVRSLQRAGIGVLLATGASADDASAAVKCLSLLGGVAEYGLCLPGNVAARDETVPSGVAEQLARLRASFHADPGIVIDRTRVQSVRASRIVAGRPRAVAGTDARGLLERQRLVDLTFRVTPHWTDFYDQSSDLARSVRKVQERLELTSVPVVALAATQADIPLVRMADTVYLPAGCLPGYRPQRRQRLIRCRQLADQVLWEATWRHLNDAAAQERAIKTLRSLPCPDWFPRSLGRIPAWSNEAIFVLGRRWPIKTGVVEHATVGKR
jgi:hypothetical protein